MINVQNLDREELKRAGIFFSSKKEAQDFIDIVREDLECRIGKEISRLLTQSQLDEFDEITNQAEATSFLEFYVPDFRDITKQKIAQVASELMQFRDVINELNGQTAGDNQSYPKQRQNIWLDSQDAMITTTSSEKAGQFRLVMDNCGPEKIRVIKLIRETTGLGLKEAKEIADSSDAEIITLPSYNHCRRIQESFSNLGASVHLEPCK